ncbi:MAG: Crp/Fnr family transcriptional regulator [Steroidobacteraceae bacterium]
MNAGPNASAGAVFAGFPALRDLPASTLERIAGAVQRVTLPAGARVFGHGSPCTHYLLLCAGSVRVQLAAENGREIVLYRVGAGETCVLTTACLLARETYSAEAVAETEVQALLLPRPAFDALLAESAPFRDFVFAAQASRLTGLLLLVQEIAFARLDIRLARRLLELGEPAGALALTHQALAAELGTAREVISRQLKEFERRGWVRLERGQVGIVDRAALGVLAAQPAR